MSDSSSSDGEDTWIHWFCGLDGHEMFCEIDKSYIEDGFNLFGLRHFVPNIHDSLDVILDRIPQSEASHELMEATCALYGLIHARYILTTAGLEAMYAKYTLQEFGNCPHYLCRGQSVVPLGVRDEPHMETVKLFCPKCQDVYVHPSHAAQRVDGAYFGTTFPHLFFMTYKSLVPDPPGEIFVPRVFGFRVHPRTAPGESGARGQQMEQRGHRLEERKRLCPSPASPTAQQSSSVIAGEGGTGASAAGGDETARAAAPCAGFPVNGARWPGATTCEQGRGRGKGRGESGSVVVQIKEEGSWIKGRGEGVNGTRAGTEASDGARLAAAALGAGGRQDRDEQMCGDAADTQCDTLNENFYQASPTRVLQLSEPSTGTAGGQESPVAGSKGGGDKDRRGISNGSVAAKGVTTSSKRRDASGAETQTAAIAAAASSGGRGEEAAFGGDGGRRGCSSAGRTDAASSAAENCNSKAEAGGTAEAAVKDEQSGGSQERGTKRFSEVELGTGAAGGGDGAGERIVLGRARGKVPRSRNNASPAVSAAPAAVVAVEGGNADSSGKRPRGLSPIT